MIRAAAARLAALLLTLASLSAAPASARAAAPFPGVPLESPAPHSHLWSYLTLGGGAGLVGVSFALAHRADITYAKYLDSTQPDEIETLFDRTARYDHLSQASLLSGEVLIAAGLYFRFIHRPAAHRVAVSLLPSRCTVSLRF